MRKILLYFSLFIFTFSFCRAQDTLVYKSGESLVVKIVKDKKNHIIYIAPPSDYLEYVNKSELDFVIYSDGTTYAVNQSIDTIRDPGNYGHFNVNIGIGFSTIQWVYTDFISGAGTPGFISISPVINASIDYGLTKKFSLGIGIAWQSITDNPNPSDNPLYGVTEYMTRTNIAMRLLKHIGRKPKLDFYYGTRLGLSIWTDNTNPSNTFRTNNQSPSFNFSFQALFGCRFFVSDAFGFHMETGIGTPYFIESGITLRINTKKNN